MQPARRRSCSGKPPHSTPMVRRPALPAASASYGVSPTTTALAAGGFAQPFQGGLEDVGVRLALFRVVRRGLLVDQVGDVGGLLVCLEFVVLGRGREGDADSVRQDPLEQGPHAGKRPHVWKVAFLQDGRPMFVQLAAPGLHVVPAQEHRHQLVAALADLRADGLEGDVVAVVAERLLPGLGVHVDGVDQGSVDVEDHGFGHGWSPGARHQSLRGSRVFRPRTDCARASRFLHREGRAQPRWLGPAANTR